MVRRQQRMCRLAFVALGVLPLLAVSLGLVYRSYASNPAGWCRTLHARLGMRAQIEDVVTPRPGLVRLDGVTLMHPETGELAVRCDAIFVTRQGDSLRYHIPSATIHTAHWSTLRRLLFRRLLQQPALLEHPLQLEIKHVAFTGPAPRKHAEDLQARLWRSQNGMESTIDFRWAGQPALDRVSVHVLRRTPAAPVPTRLEIRTGDLSLPCDLFLDGDLASSAPWDAMMFQGYVWIEPLGGAWNAELRGSLHAIDLQAWIGAPFGEVFTGTARAEGIEARIANGVVTDLVGTLHCDGGRIAGKLLQSAAEHLQLEVSWPNDAPLSDDAAQDDARAIAWDYQQLALHVEMNAQGLRLTGVSTANTAAYGTAMVLAKDGACRVATPADERLSPSALVKTLVREASHTLPLHDRAKPLWLALPLEPHPTQR